MKNSDLHQHVIKKLYTAISVLLFLVALIITIQIEVENWNNPRLYVLLNYPGEIVVAVSAMIGGFYMMYRVRHYNEDKEGD